MRKVLGVDFDGVIAAYSGDWSSIGKPLPLVRTCLRALQNKGWWICIWTCRDASTIEPYCKEEGIPYDSINTVPSRPWGRPKVCCDVYLDDRGMTFDGRWNWELVEAIQAFHPHWETEANIESFEPSAIVPHVESFGTVIPIKINSNDLCDVPFAWLIWAPPHTGFKYLICDSEEEARGKCDEFNDASSSSSFAPFFSSTIEPLFRRMQS